MSETQPHQRPSPALLRRPVFLGSLAFGFLAFGLPIYSKALGADALTIGGLYTTFTLTVLVLRPLIGRALDRFGRKAFLVAGLSGYAVTMVLFAAAGDLVGLYVARFAQGVASSLLWITLNTAVADLAEPSERGREMGRIQETTARAEVIGAFIGFGFIFYLPPETGWPIIFAAYALLAAGGALIALRRVPETRPQAMVDAPASRAIPPRLARLMVIVFTTGISTAMIAPIYLIYLQDRFTTDVAALAWAFLPAGILYSVLPSRLGGLGDRLGRAPMMALGLVGAGALSALLPLIPALGWLVVLYSLAAVGWSLADPAEAALVADIAGEDRRGTGYGLYAFAHFMGLSIGPVVGGWLYDRVGQQIPFFLNGAVLLFSAAWVLFALRDPCRPVAGRTGEEGAPASL